MRSSVSAMSLALSETGNTRSPRSVLSGTPASSKNSFTASGGKAYSELLRKRALVHTFSRNSCGALSFVTLHRPFPVMRSFFPVFPFGSRTVTESPRRAAVIAVISPAAPAPAIITSVIEIFVYLIFAPDPFELPERIG